MWDSSVLFVRAMPSPKPPAEPFPMLQRQSLTVLTLVWKKLVACSVVVDVGLILGFAELVGRLRRFFGPYLCIGTGHA